MNCSNCQAANPDGANFCQKCGQKLLPVCPNCGHENLPGSNFCNNCGLKLADSGPKRLVDGGRAPTLARMMPPKLVQILESARGAGAMQGERRTVTMLFCDLQGSTAAAEKLDPEEWAEIMNGAFEHMIAPVYRYEGTLARLMGDAVLAFFGAPVAHEDDPRRAILAGRDIIDDIRPYCQSVRRDWGVDINVRVGINTGLVVVGAMGSDLRVEYTAMGDAINLAARMEQSAEPGTVQITEDTYRLVAPLFEFEALGEIEVKGKDEPVRAYRLLRETGIQTRFAVAARHGLTPYVGRRRELDQLNDLFEQVKKRQGQVVFISGEAGIGKSRLLAEFRGAIQDEGAIWLEGQCIAFRRHTAYLPLIDILKQTFDITAKDDEAGIIQRVDEAVATWDEAARGTVPYLKFLLSVDPGDPEIKRMGPRERRAGIFDGLRALLIQESQTKPLVLVVEDLHWLDDQSEAALTALVDLVSTEPVMLLLTYRPAYTHSLGERSYFNHLLLGDLKPEESAALARGVLNADELPLDLEQLIAGKGEGNPFYIEEVIRSLLEAGTLHEQNGAYELTRPAEKIRVPNTVQEVILSRIDRLEQEAKRALQLASVIGREFAAKLLNHISDLEAQLDEILEELKFLELIYQKTYFPEQVYMFKHALTQDVAYRTLLRERRKVLHRLIGAAIEELYTDRLSEQYEVLAHHYYEGKAWDQALTFLILAGDKAAAAYANQDALNYYARALEVCELQGSSTQETVADIAQKRGMVNLNVADHKAAIADFVRLQAAAKRLKDPHLESMALTLRGWVEVEAHDPTAAGNSLKGALALAGEISDDIRLAASAIYAAVLKVSNRHAEAKTYYEVAKQLIPTVDDPAMRSWWWQVGPQFLIWEGRFDDALELYRHYDDDVTHSVNLRVIWFKALSLGGKGSFQQALDLLKLVLASTERIGDTLVRIRVLNTLGWIYGELQDHRQAMDWNREGIKAAQEVGFPDPEVECNARLNLADNLMALDRLDEAEDQFQNVEQIVRSPWPEAHYMIWRYSQHLFHSYGELWLIRGDYGKTLSYADECLELAEKSNSRKNIVKGRRLRGQALSGQGMLAEAEQELVIALEVAKRVGNPPQLWKTYVALGDLLQAQRRPEAAQDSYKAAMAVTEGVAANLNDQSLRETFLNSDYVQELQLKVDHGTTGVK